MDWLKTWPNERLEGLHIRKMGDMQAQHHRRAASGLHGVGLLFLASAPTYNSSTRRLTVAAQTCAVDVDGNLIYLADNVESEPIAASDVGVAPLYLWAAVELAATPAATANRVEWVDAAPPERTQGRHTELRDSVSLVVAALQPPDTASGTKYCPLLKYTSWAGSPAAPSGMIPWWTVNSWREKLTTARQFDGILPMLGELIVSLADNIIGTAGEWSGAVNAPHPNALNALDLRIAPLEAWRAALDAFWEGGTWQNVPLTAGHGTGGWAWNSNRIWRANDTGSLYLELSWPAWRKAGIVRVRALPSSSLGVACTLVRTSKLSHANTTLDTAVAAAGGAEETLSLSFGSDAQNLSDEGDVYHLVISATGAASVDYAVVYAVTLSSSLQ